MNPQHLEKNREITLTVAGRKTGRKISIPVWFVLQGEQLYLLPVKGSDTQWYRNILQDPAMQIGVPGEQAEYRAVPMTEAESVHSVVERFREKYGAGDVKKYYSKFDVAVRAQAA
jgi:deazaflavin-dependent oxidoreductase (nitroreductase family)